MKKFSFFLLIAVVAFACQLQDDPTSLSDDAASAGGQTPGAYVIASTDSPDGKTFTITVDQSNAKATSNMLFQILACDGTPLTVNNVTGFTVNGVDKMDKLNSDVGGGTACANAYPDPYIHFGQSINTDVYVIEIKLDTPSKGGSFVIKSTNDCFGINDPNYSFSHDCTPPPTCYEEESAWSDGPRYVSRGNWATYTPYSAGNVNVYAGKTKFAGVATMSSVSADNKVTISIALNPGWSLQEVSNPVKIQGYDLTPPAGNPSPGRFASKGSSLTVTLAKANFYGIHLDVREAVACPE